MWGAHVWVRLSCSGDFYPFRSAFRPAAHEATPLLRADTNGGCRTFRDIEDRCASLTRFIQGPPSETRAQPRAGSAKRDGAEMRDQWVGDIKSKGIVLSGHGKRYTTESGGLS